MPATATFVTPPPPDAAAAAAVPAMAGVTRGVTLKYANVTEPSDSTRTPKSLVTAATGAALWLLAT